MCERALQEKEASVNIILDFVLSLTNITLLFPGHKPINVMVDSRTKEQFDKIKSKRDKPTLKFDIANRLPIL